MKLKPGDLYGPFLLGKLRDTNDTLNVFNATVIEPGNIGDPKGIGQKTVGEEKGDQNRENSDRESVARENSDRESIEEVELFILSEATGLNRCEVNSDEFLKKMQKAVELCHPSVVRVLSTGRVKDTVYAATEVIHGFTFGELPLTLKGRGLPPPMAVWMLAEAGDALAVLGDHNSKNSIQATGALYLAPSDIYAEITGRIKLSRLDLTASLLATWRGSKNLLKDKFGYMSPEQIMGQSATQLSDLFICGILLHELLTGRRLFAKDSKSKTILAIKDPQVPTPSELSPWINGKLDELVLSALEKDPLKRPRSITAWTESLREYIAENHPSFDSSKAKEFLRQGIEAVSSLSPTCFDTTSAKSSGSKSAEEWSSGEESSAPNEGAEKRARNTILVEAAKDMVAAPTRTAIPAVEVRVSNQDCSVMAPTTNIDHGSGFFSWLRKERWGIHDTVLALFAAVLLFSAFALLWLRADSKTRNNYPTRRDSTNPGRSSDQDSSGALSPENPSVEKNGLRWKLIGYIGYKGYSTDNSNRQSSSKQPFEIKLSVANSLKKTVSLSPWKVRLKPRNQPAQAPLFGSGSGVAPDSISISLPPGEIRSFTLGFEFPEESKESSWSVLLP